MTLSLENRQQGQKNAENWTLGNKAMNLNHFDKSLVDAKSIFILIG